MGAWEEGQQGAWPGPASQARWPRLLLAAEEGLHREQHQRAANEAAVASAALWGQSPGEGRGGDRLRGGGGHCRTHLVEELVLRQVPDVPRLAHGRGAEATQKAR